MEEGGGDARFAAWLRRHGKQAVIGDGEGGGPGPGPRPARKSGCAWGCSYLLELGLQALHCRMHAPISLRLHLTP